MSIEEAIERSPELGIPASGAPRLRLRTSPATPKHGPLFSRPWLSAPELRGSPRRQTFSRLAANSGPGRAPGPGGGEGGRRGRGGGRPPGGGRGRAVARHLPALRVVQAATAAAAARPRGRGGAGSCAPLWAPPPRCAPLQPRRPPCPGPEPESRRRGWSEAGRGGSLQHLPLLPLPAAQIKKQQKATNHPQA